MQDAFSTRLLLTLWLHGLQNQKRPSEGHGFSRAEKSCLNAALAAEVKATYTVPKLEDFSVTTLDVAVGDIQLALRDEKREIRTDSDFKAFRDRWLARKNGILT